MVSNSLHEEWKRIVQLSYTVEKVKTKNLNMGNIRMKRNDAAMQQGSTARKWLLLVIMAYTAFVFNTT